MNCSYFEKLLDDLLRAEHDVVNSKSIKEYNNCLDRRNNLRLKLCDYVYEQTGVKKELAENTDYMDFHSNYDLGLID